MERSPRTNGVVPLSALQPGLPARVMRIDAGCGPVGRLTALGLVPGTAVEVLSANGGPLLRSVLGRRLMLRRGMAAKVLVGASEHVNE
jgi:Fe2+ transport system protein FeoA